ncbi:MAG: pantetheine-phosphate adenylyltransferase [Nitrospinales bacterium]
MLKKRTAIYPGTFDPVTKGHIDIMARALKLFDHLVVAVALSSPKQPLFSIDDRVLFIEKACKDKGLEHVEARPFENLLIDFAVSNSASVIIKGLRAVSDFEYELQMGLVNRNLNDSLETIFLIPSQEHSFLSSSFVKEIARHGGDVSKMVPKPVLKGLKDIYK